MLKRFRVGHAKRDIKKKMLVGKANDDDRLGLTDRQTGRLHIQNIIARCNFDHNSDMKTCRLSIFPSFYDLKSEGTILHMLLNVYS